MRCSLITYATESSVSMPPQTCYSELCRYGASGVARQVEQSKAEMHRYAG